MIGSLGKYKSNFWLATLSFLGLVILMIATNPIDKIIYAVVFFVLFFIFMVNFGYLLVRVQLGEVAPKDRYRIVAISLIILTLIMFRSAQSLNWVDALILALISFGLVFYISRRA
ncbi:MAG TPA: hypothetical protein VHD84_03120 [Candidatus Saccharimonadales bacterium]|nr:hypothetical protein [Candidatus Saccharimonadales bacterium]